ncbi:MAG TPA: GNAT family N-acetyltransferase [Bdellovibrionales bacterium]|nr:GNAT family N-acetyltransferase [Bdellovibrionales bacterium]
MDDLKLELHDRWDSEEAKTILNNLRAYNMEKTGITEPPRDLTVTLKDGEGRMAGGLTGHTAWGWLFVKLFWVSETHRGQGLGTRLLEAAEREARARGCEHVWLDTFSFQARGFYEKHGYRIFGTLDDYPRGHRRHFLHKKLEGNNK